MARNHHWHGQAGSSQHCCLEEVSPVRLLKSLIRFHDQDFTDYRGPPATSKHLPATSQVEQNNRDSTEGNKGNEDSTPIVTTPACLARPSSFSSFASVNLLFFCRPVFCPYCFFPLNVTTLFFNASFVTNSTFTASGSVHVMFISSPFSVQATVTGPCGVLVVARAQDSSPGSGLTVAVAQPGEVGFSPPTIRFRK
jgi:hypothetical protein